MVSSMNSKTLAFVFGGALVAVVAYWGFSANESSYKPQDSLKNIALEKPEVAFQKAEQLIKEGKGTEAITIVDKYKNLPEASRGNKNWGSLEVQALTASENYQRLVALFRQAPQSFDGDEHASLALAKVFLQYQKWEEYDDLQQRWKSKKTKDLDWFLLEADYLLMRSEFAKAETLLHSKKFEGNSEIERLLRISLLQAKDDVKKSWTTLEEAYKIDPKNSRVRSLRGSLLERLNNMRLARVEYAAAFIADDTNPLMRDQLAEFYRRNRDFGMALATWSEGLEKGTADYIWSKTIFWNKMIAPITFQWNSKPVPEGLMQPFVSYLLGLPAGTFWDEEQFQQLPNIIFYVKTRQEAYWLKVIDAIARGNESEALNKLEGNPFSQQSWDPDLENALRQVLSYRLNKGLPPRSVMTADGKSLESEYNAVLAKIANHPLFIQLNALATLPQEQLASKMPKELESLLLSQEAFTAVFLSAGWREAGLTLHKMDIIPTTMPNWFSYSIAQALLTNRSDTAALEFINKQPSNNFLLMLKGEILLSKGQKSEGLAILKNLVRDPSSVGFRTSLVVSTIYVDQKEWEEAKGVILGNHALKEHILGKELLARIAFQEGKVDEADKMFTDIQNQSFLAKSYLAKRAYDKKDFKKAKEITLQMLQEYPDVLQIRENLKIIEDTEAGKAPQGELPSVKDQTPNTPTKK